MEHMLQQILQEIKSVKTDVLLLHQDNQSLKDGIQELNQNQILLAERQSKLEENQIHLEKNQVQTNIKISDIHTAVVRLENDQPKDIVALLETFDDYFHEKDSELATLNHRVFRVESKLERMSMRA